MRIHVVGLLALLGGCLIPLKGEEAAEHARATHHYPDPDQDLAWVARAMLEVPTDRYVPAGREVTAYQLRGDPYVVASDDARRFVVRRCVWRDGANRCELTDVRDGVVRYRLRTPRDFAAITDQQMERLARDVRDVLEAMHGTALGMREKDAVPIARKPALHLWAGKERTYDIALDDDNVLTVERTAPHAATREVARVTYPPGTLRMLAVYGSFDRAELGAVALEHEEARSSGTVIYHSWVLFADTAGGPVVWVIPGAVDDPVIGSATVKTKAGNLP